MRYKEDECKALGTEPPRYEIIGNGIRVHFKALESALLSDTKNPNRHYVGLGNSIMEMIKENPKITMMEMAKRLKVTTRTVEREMKKLNEDGCIERVGGKRYGYWNTK